MARTQATSQLLRLQIVESRATPGVHTHTRTTQPRGADLARAVIAVVVVRRLLQVERVRDVHLLLSNAGRRARGDIQEGLLHVGAVLGTHQEVRNAAVLSAPCLGVCLGHCTAIGVDVDLVACGGNTHT